jgi:hypothetical protein
MASLYNSSEAHAQVIRANVENAYLDDFRPNKFVEVHYIDMEKNSRLGGTYFILGCNTTFVCPSAHRTREMACAAQLELSRRFIM